jgi:D-beta-D-heptose 7-phosphate kinase / D-beta-D-heptose 1-phosphate adenosyltransferase
MSLSPPPRIVVVGDLILDTYLDGSCARISPEAPVPVVAVSGREGRLGGAGNVATNLRALGCEVRLLSVVGVDGAATQLRGLLEADAIASDGLLDDSTRPTPEKTRVVAAHQQMLRFDHEITTPVSESLADRLLAKLQNTPRDCAAIILSDYGKGVLTDRVCAEAIAWGRGRGIPVLCDPKGADFTRYRGATAITPNRQEAGAAVGHALSDDAELEAAGRELKSVHGLEFLLVTLGPDGMALFWGDEVQRMATVAQEVFDVSGAGDTVIATLAWGLATAQPLVEACALANAAAGVVVGKLGTARVTPAEIDALRSPAVTRASGRSVVDLETLAERVGRRQRAGRRVVFTNGCFDLIHAGHVKFLEDAAALGDVLIVGLNSDDSVRRLKGDSRPIQDSRDRAALLAALGVVDYVVIFEQDTPMTLIERLQPDVLVKGQDYVVGTVVGAEQVQGYGGEVVLLPIMEGRSTSTIIEKILKSRQKRLT